MQRIEQEGACGVPELRPKVAPLPMKKTALHLLLTALLAASTQADTVFEESFNGVQSPQGLVQWQGNKDRVSESDGSWFEVVPDENNAFGEGADNRVLVLHDRSEAGQVNLYGALKGTEDVVTATFDFVEPADAEGGPAVFRVGTARNEVSELAVNLVLRDGGFDGGPRDLYTLGEKHRVTIVANNSTAAVSYGDTSLPGQHYDVYIDGRSVLKAAPFDTKDGSLQPGTSLDGIRFLTYFEVTKDQTFLIDNIVVKNGAHAP